ncbi:hypothetical protein FACS1894159_08030 [Bacteroidia bacterium]|nr:hypothetical protein FACS1894159_08030 [Bacteroidia bacterium]
MIILSALLICLCVQGVVAQYYVGAKVGYGGGTARLYPEQEMAYAWGYKSGGLSWKYYSPERVVGAVQVDLEFTERGYRINNYGNNLDSSYFRHLSSVIIPFSWQPHIYFFNRHLRVFLNAGINISYNFSSSVQLVSAREGPLMSEKWPMLTNRDNRLGYGLSGGLGLGVLTGRLEYFVEGRYYFGYSDILKNRNVYPTNPLRSPLDNLNLSFGVFYRLGSGGILSPTQAEIDKRRGKTNTTQFQKKN